MYQLSTLKGWAVVSLVSNSMAFTAPYEKRSALYTGWHIYLQVLVSPRLLNCYTEVT